MNITLDNWDASRWPNFTPEEFACQETDEMEMDSLFLDRLQDLRTELGFAMPVTSGYRSPRHSAERGKKDGPGAHSSGQACDIGYNSGQRCYMLVTSARSFGFVGLGVHKSFVHLDMMGPRPHAPRPTFWLY